MDGQEYSLSLECTATIATLKDRLVQVTQVPVDRQRLVYMGKMLTDE